MSEQYPWLCSTTKQKFDCASQYSNMVSQEESDNFERYTTEAYGTYGLKFSYYKVSMNLERDKLFGEDQLQVIERSFYFMGYTESIPPNVRTYQLQGIYGEDLLTIQVGRIAFQYWSKYGGTDKNTPDVYEEFEPKIGDVVYLEPNDTFYEIRDVKFFNSAFGLQSHTYTITLKVYKDTKLTIDNKNPTLANTEDPIYKVATSDFSEQYEINDPLKLNDELEDEALKESKNQYLDDVIYHREEGKIRIDPFDGW